MDKIFDENDFIDNRNLHARETETSSGNNSKDTDNNSHMDESLIKKTRDVWEPLYGREITDTEATEIIKKFSNIFDVMTECGIKQDPSPANHNGEKGYA